MKRPLFAVLLAVAASTAGASPVNPYILDYVLAQGMAPIGAGNCSSSSASCVVASLVSSGAVSGSTGAFSDTITSTKASGVGVQLVTGTDICFGNGGTSCIDSQGSYVRLTGGILLGDSDNAGITLRGDTGSKINWSTVAQMTCGGDGNGCVFGGTNPFIRLIPAALGTCAQASESRFQTVGGAAAALTKACLCTWDGSTAKWVNLLNPSDRTGTTTTCPAT